MTGPVRSGPVRKDVKPELEPVGTGSVRFRSGLLTFLVNRFFSRFFFTGSVRCSGFPVSMPTPSLHVELRQLLTPP